MFYFMSYFVQFVYMHTQVQYVKTNYNKTLCFNYIKPKLSKSEYHEHLCTFNCIKQSNVHKKKEYFENKN